jgi:prepilin-type N-terminal cleavage/methylation domain-containing protein
MDPARASAVEILVAATAKRSGFTIIELMIAIGIIGILATIAIPTLMKFQLKAKAAEVKGNLSAIRVTEEAYFGEYGSYVSALPPIPTIVRTTQMPWALLPADVHGFNTLGWSPTGQVYFQYAVASNGSSAYTAAGRSDIDGDTVYNTWGYVRPSGASAMGVDGPFGTCSADGVVGGLKIVGPCDAASGQSAF